MGDAEKGPKTKRRAGLKNGVSSPCSNIISSPPVEYQGNHTIDRGDSSKEASPESERETVCWRRKGDGDGRATEVQHCHQRTIDLRILPHGCNSSQCVPVTYTKGPLRRASENHDAIYSRRAIQVVFFRRARPAILAVVCPWTYLALPDIKRHHPT